MMAAPASMPRGLPPVGLPGDVLAEEGQARPAVGREGLRVVRVDEEGADADHEHTAAP